jgi:hypothetical protein
MGAGDRARRCGRRWLPAVALLLQPLLLALALPAAAQTPAPPAAPAATSAKPPGIITCVGPAHGECSTKEVDFALGSEIQIGLDGTTAIDPMVWSLYLDGRVVTEAKSARMGDDGRSLIFTLRRTDAVRPAWSALLGAPDETGRTVTVSVGQADSTTTLRLSGAVPIRIRLTLFRPWGAFFAVIVALLVGGLAVVHGRSSFLLRDRLLPQVPMQEQPYSLGRLQMGFWFVLILIAFLFLWIYLEDYNTLTSQALMLMGISAATGLGAIAANGFNNTTLTTTDTALRQVGFTKAQDVVDLRKQITAAAAGPARDALEARLAVWTQLTADYVTKDPISDIINDENGAALHRLQVMVWTLVLGGVFVWEAWQSLAMPAFSDTLLALMAVSGGSYVGFKVAEKT